MSQSRASTQVSHNDCNSQGFGVELHNTTGADVAGNDFSFRPPSVGCDVRLLTPGDKLDFSRVLPGAGTCEGQPFHQC